MMKDFGNLETLVCLFEISVIPRIFMDQAFKQKEIGREQKVYITFTEMIILIYNNSNKYSPTRQL